jgi:hypothetical protein
MYKRSKNMEFKKTIKQSFGKVKRDFDILKVSFIDWIRYLGYNQTLMQKHIESLEARVKELEEERKILVATY